MDYGHLQIQAFPALRDNYIWLLIHPLKKKVIAIDPGEAEPLLAFLNAHQLQLEAILITHHHFDHTGGVTALKNTYQAKVYGPENSKIIEITHPVKESDIFFCLDASIKVLNIPGHTLDHIAYQLPGMIFCGDTLFSAGCGKIFEGTVAQMFSSIQKIAALPEDTLIYCAHEYTLQNLQFAQVVEPHNNKIQSTLAEVMALRQANIPSVPTYLHHEKEVNPFLRCHIDEVVLRVEQHTGLKCTNTEEVFQHLREWKNNFAFQKPLFKE
ncbi:MAG: hydroxyacylglutathione hydrolase [Legionellaceae bacterium]|nr:hydroxyacylglutathione hydrolase [Legionellaceae bacterium]